MLVNLQYRLIVMRVVLENSHLSTPLDYTTKRHKIDFLLNEPTFTKPHKYWDIIYWITKHVMFLCVPCHRKVRFTFLGEYIGLFVFYRVYFIFY